jgi:hypothetical protein
MWPSVAFRIAAVPSVDQPSFLRVAAANFQAVPAELQVESTSITADPEVIRGVMTIRDFIELLKLWRARGPAPLGRLVLAPPSDISQLDWSPDLPSDMLWGPLLERLPVSAGLYKVHRLTGGGGQVSSEMKDMLQGQMFQLRLAPIWWSQQYLGMQWDGNMNYLTVHLPVAVRFEINYEPNTSEMQLDVFFRGPYRLEQFWSRVSDGPWNISLPRHSFRPLQADERGWAGGRLQLTVEFEKAISAWVGTALTPNRFDWLISYNRPEPLAPATPQIQSRQPAAQLIGDLHGLIATIGRAEIASFLDEAVRCLEVGAFRATAIMVWAGAIAVLQDAADQHGLKRIEKAARLVNPKAHDLRHRNDLQYFTDDLLLNTLEKAGLLNKTELGLLLQQLKRRNAYAHPSGVEPSVEEVRAMIAELVRIVFSRFTGNQSN